MKSSGSLRAVIIIRNRSRYSDWLRGRSSRPDEGQYFSLIHIVQTGSGSHADSYPMGTEGSFPRGKAAGE
jgi:hypothetical protein